MIMFFLQTLILVAAAFALGCLFGYWLKRGVTPPHRRSGAAAAISHRGAAHATTAGELAAPRPHYEPASRPLRRSPAPSRPIVAAAAIAPVAPQAGAVAPAVVPHAGVASAAAAPVVPAEPVTAPAPAQKAKPARTAAARSTAKPAAAKPATAKTAKAGSEGPASAKSKPAQSAARTDNAAPAPEPAGKAPKARKPKPGPAAVADNLKQIKGVGPQIEAKLNAAGINSFAQIASWSKEEQAQFAEQLSFAGRIEREDWVGQAKILSQGGTTDFARRVARGEVESSADAKPKAKR